MSYCICSGRCCFVYFCHYSSLVKQVCEIYCNFLDAVLQLRIGSLFSNIFSLHEKSGIFGRNWLNDVAFWFFYIENLTINFATPLVKCASLQFEVFSKLVFIKATIFGQTSCLHCRFNTSCVHFYLLKYEWNSNLAS